MSALLPQYTRRAATRLSVRLPRPSASSDLAFPISALSASSSSSLPQLPSSSFFFFESQQRSRSFWKSTTSTNQPWKAYMKPLTLQPVVPYVKRSVPSSYVFPPYALPDFAADPRTSQHALKGIEVKSAEAIKGMRKACEMASYIRAYAGTCVQVGRSTDEVDAMVHAEVIRQGVYPSPLGYANFPKSICTSVNQVVVHGIPDGRKLEEGDIVNIDVSVYVKEGYHGDCSGMFVAGKADPLAAKLISTTRECLDGAIALCKPGLPFNAIGAYIEPKARAEGYSIVRQFCGHGIGSIFHMPPLVYHCVNHVQDRMQPGMTFTIEPMLNEGDPEIEMLDDGWTYITCDGGRSAQFEETILITENGYEILTKHNRPVPSLLEQ